MKKIISILLVAVLLFSLAPMSFAEGETYKYQYIIKDSIGGIILADCTIETTNSQLAYTDMPFSSGEADQYTITEWFEKDELGEAFSFPVALTAGSTKELYGYISDETTGKVTYHNCDSAKNNNVGLYVAGKTLPLSNPSKTGYDFTKWTLTDDSSAAAVTSIFSTQTGDFDVYAWWTAHTYTVKYDPNGGTGDTMQDSVMTYDGTEALRKNTYTNTGYVFSGWALEATGEKKFEDEQSKPNVTAKDGETVTLYAVWEPVSYTIKFDGNGATSGEMTDQTMTYDVEEKLTKNAFVKTGYNFMGWAKDSAATTADYADEAAVKNLKDTQGAEQTLYAVWEPVTYTIKYNGNNATSGEMTAQTMTYNVEAKLTKNAFARTGYKFAGWAKDSAATTADYADEAAVKNLKSTQGDVQDLYAVWTKYTVYTQTTSTTGGTATYKLGSNTAVAITATAQSISLASTETLVVTATPTSGYYAKIYTDSNKSGTYECYKSSDSKGAAISYTLTQADIEAGITVKVLYSTNPITGDGFDPMLWVIALAAAGAGAAITIAAKKKAHN